MYWCILYLIQYLIGDLLRYEYHTSTVCIVCIYIILLLFFFFIICFSNHKSWTSFLCLQRLFVRILYSYMLCHHSIGICIYIYTHVYVHAYTFWTLISNFQFEILPPYVKLWRPLGRVSCSIRSISDGRHPGQKVKLWRLLGNFTASKLCLKK